MPTTIKFIFLCNILICLLVLSCARHVLETQHIATDAKFNFLFACDSTKFKDAIRNRLVATYSSYCNIDIINIKGLKAINPERYDVVLIMDTCLAWTKFNPSLTHFLEKTKDRKNIVLFMTAANPDWEYRYQDIDAITSASRTENEASIYLELSKRIDTVIHGEHGSF